jgi:hypothetical protein
MIDGKLIIDGISHAQDMRPESLLPPGVVLRDLNHQVNSALPADVRVPGHDATASFPSADNMCNALFLESDVDLAVTHHVPLYSYVKGGLIPIEANRMLAERAPQRWIVYAGVDPTQDVTQAIESLEQQVEAIPQIVGLKLYPAQLDPLRTLDLSDENYFPLWERVRDLGLKVIAVHKAVPYGPVPINPFKVEDVEGAAGAFPDINFEIMHGGAAFVEETAMMLGRFPNVYTNLEGLNIVQYLAPQRIERVLAEFLFAGGASKIIWGTGGPQLGHPQFYLKRFLEFQFSEATMAEYNIPQIDDETRYAILGGNYLRMIDLDLEAAKARISGDEYQLRLSKDGLAPMFSTWTQGSEERSTDEAVAV